MPLYPSLLICQQRRSHVFGNAFFFGYPCISTLSDTWHLLNSHSNVKKAAKELRIGYATIYHKLKKWKMSLKRKKKSVVL